MAGRFKGRGDDTASQMPWDAAAPAFVTERIGSTSARQVGSSWSALPSTEELFMDGVSHAAKCAMPWNRVMVRYALIAGFALFADW